MYDLFLEGVPMQQKYWSILEAAHRLGLRPSTLRRWVEEGRVLAVRLAGPGGHRRIPYMELALLAEQRGETWPPLEPLVPDASYRVADAARYLGVSARFLWNTGLLESQGGKLTGADLLALENAIYAADNGMAPLRQATQDTRTEGKGSRMMMRHGMGPMGRVPTGRMGPWWMGAFGPGAGPHAWWSDWEEEVPHSALWLRSMKRHLEAMRADIEDRLRWVEEQLRRREEGGQRET